MDLQNLQHHTIRSASAEEVTAAKQKFMDSKSTVADTLHHMLSLLDTDQPITGEKRTSLMGDLAMVKERIEKMDWASLDYFEKTSIGIVEPKQTE